MKHITADRKAFVVPFGKEGHYRVKCLDKQRLGLVFDSGEVLVLNMDKADIHEIRKFVCLAMIDAP